MTECVQPTHAASAAPSGRLLLVLMLTATFMLVEAVGGWISG